MVGYLLLGVICIMMLLVLFAPREDEGWDREELAGREPVRCTDCGEELTEEEINFLEDLCFKCNEIDIQEFGDDWKHPDTFSSSREEPDFDLLRVSGEGMEK